MRHVGQTGGYRHAVQLYQDDDQLYRCLVTDVATALRERANCLLILGERHRRGLHTALAAADPDMEDRLREGYLKLVPAEELLSDCLRQGVLDSARLHTRLERLLAESGHPPARIWDQFTDLLCLGGHRQAALAVEAVWNDLLRTHACIVCATVSLSSFPRAADQVFFSRLCREYDRVFPADADPAPADEVARQREVGLLQQQVQALQEELRRCRESKTLLEQALRARGSSAAPAASGPRPRLDYLTGLASREQIQWQLSQLLRRAGRDDGGVAVVLVDLDGFMLINESFGHAAGDRVLQVVADRLRRHLRQGRLAGRLGGDKFVLVLEGTGCSKVLGRFAQTLHEEIREPVDLNGQVVDVSCSIGISRYPPDGVSADRLIGSAELAAQSAKRKGRDTYSFADGWRHDSAQRVRIRTALREALPQREFSLVYQPQVRTRSGTLGGVEALLRWNSADLGGVEPEHFIPVAEESGLIVPIGAWVIDEACRQGRAWLDQRHAVRVSINVSVAQLRRHDLVSTVRDALARHGLPPALLQLELTESVLMDSPEAVIEVFRELKRIGVRLAIDDFGTGYSSLSYLRQLPVDVLKVDGMFVREIDSGSSDNVIVRTIIAMAHQLDMEVVAEGVEHPAQHAYLQRKRCDLVQGFLFGRPLSARQLSANLERLMREGVTALVDPSGSYGVSQLFPDRPVAVPGTGDTDGELRLVSARPRPGD